MTTPHILLVALLGMFARLATAQLYESQWQRREACKQTFIVNLHRACDASAGRKTQGAEERGWASILKARDNDDDNTDVHRFWRDLMPGWEESSKSQPGFIETNGNLHRFWRGTHGENGAKHTSSKTVDLDSSMTQCLVHMVTNQNAPPISLDLSRPLGDDLLAALREIYSDESSAVSLMATYCCTYGCDSIALSMSNNS